ncbi:MAG: hypothetical protein U0795_07140 [Pirellulales bacterium]
MSPVVVHQHLANGSDVIEYIFPVDEVTGIDFPPSCRSFLRSNGKAVGEYLNAVWRASHGSPAEVLARFLSTLVPRPITVVDNTWYIILPAPIDAMHRMVPVRSVDRAEFQFEHNSWTMLIPYLGLKYGTECFPCAGFVDEPELVRDDISMRWEVPVTEWEGSLTFFNSGTFRDFLIRNDGAIGVWDAESTPQFHRAYRNFEEFSEDWIKHLRTHAVAFFR